MSGGELKLLNFYKALAVHHNVQLITATYPTRYEEISHAPGFVEYRVPKPEIDGVYWNALHAEGMNGELSGVMNAVYGRTTPAFREMFDRLLPQADVVIHDFPAAATWDAATEVPRKPRIYNSYNVELALHGSIMTGDCDRALELIETCEGAIARQSHRIFAMSTTDATGLSLLYGVPEHRVTLLPMGVAEDEFGWVGGETRSARKTCLFIGGAHGPNREAAAAFVEIARRSPQHDFVLAGRVDISHLIKPANLTVTGPVSAAEKQALFKTSEVFVNMMRSGSGVNVKVVEALAAGHRLISTSIGIRGLEDAPDVIQAETLEDAVVALRTLPEATLTRAQRQRWMLDRNGWAQIAKRAAAHILAAVDEGERPAQEPLADIDLYLNDYPLGEGESGGARRMLRLLELSPSKRMKVLLTLTDAPGLQLRARSPDLFEINVPKHRSQRLAQDRNNRHSKISIADILAIEGAAMTPLLIRILRTLSRRAATVVFEHAYMAGLLPILRDENYKGRIVYDSHNDEAKLKLDMLKAARIPDAKRLAALTKTAEDALLDAADVVVCVSQADAAALAARRPERPAPKVILNGTDIPPLAAKAGGGILRLVFLGSGHPPNVEGLRAFLTGPFAGLDNVHLDIIGGACGGVYDLADSRTTLWGVVDDARKASLLARADIAINPSISGGGSSLKIGDYLAMGIPVVTTPHGQRGFGDEIAEVLISTPLENFDEAIRRLQQDPAARAARGRAGRAFAERILDWATLARQHGALVSPIQAKPATTGPRKRVLAITYRYTEPRKGGAEEYLYQVLRRFAFDHDCDVDLIAPDLSDIPDRWGLAAIPGGQASSRPILAEFARSVRLLPIDKFEAKAVQLCGEWLARLRIEQQAKLVHSFRALVPETGFAGGWHAVEGLGSDRFRWSTNRAFINVAPQVEEVMITAEMPTEASVHLTCGDWTAPPEKGVGRQRLRVKLTPSNTVSVIEIGVSSCVNAPDDSRALGLRIRSLKTRRGRTWTDIPLDADILTRLRRDHPRAVVDAYVAQARHRPDIEEEAFEIARGLDSSAALAAIERDAAGYDHVIVHGVQFGFVRKVCATLNNAGVPYVLLPHMHLDDDFYHWRMMYDCVRGAQQVITVAGDPLQDEVLKTLTPNLLPAAGGGVTPVEYALPDTSAWQALRKARRVPKAYFVVLGRKVASKGYAHVLEAFARCGFGRDVGLVLIGPDDDGVPIDNANVFVLGSQPRDVVLGALAGSIALISMSESESFGIVLAESWMMARPVIANRGCQAFVNLVEDAVDGLLVGSVESLSEAMRTLRDDPALAARLGAAGRAKARETLSWDKLAQTLLKSLKPPSRRPTPSATIQKRGTLARSIRKRLEGARS
jgi:glycosyltransferase involved in cell wall biosynthesis